MKTFKQFIIEGGNVKIGEHSADSIHVTPENREQHQKDIHDMLSSVHDSFHKETGKHLFGKNKKALNTGSAYSGSTRSFMDKKIPHEEFAKHKPEVGDVDVQIPKEHAQALHQHIQPGKKFGKYTVLGVKKSGTESHALMKHDSGKTHQIDFEHTQYEHDEPSKFEQFSHSSDWKDIKHGIKGVHHKVLMNAIGGKTHKFSTSQGLGNREGEPNWSTETHHITHTLFGKHADEKHLHSFSGLVHNIKHHTPPEHHQAIYDKFKNSLSKIKKTNHEPALHMMKSQLNVKDHEE